jgi:hypothetical protein
LFSALDLDFVPFLGLKYVLLDSLKPVFGACSSSSDQKWSYFLFGFLSEAVVTNRKTRAHMDVSFWIIEFLWMSIGQILLHHRCDGCFL